jgi:histidine phosphotransferase ChpT
LVRGLHEDEKIEPVWPDNESTGIEPDRESMKVLLNLVLVGIESLPRGGTLNFSLNGSDLVLSARGSGAALREESAAAMSADTDIEALTARSVQAYFLIYLIGLQGGKCQVEGAEMDAVSFTVRVPA